MQADLLLAGDQAGRELKVRTQLVDILRTPGIVAGRLDASGQLAVRIFKAADVVALPALNGYRDLRDALHGGVGIYTDPGVHFFRNLIHLFAVHFR